MRRGILVAVLSAMVAAPARPVVATFATFERGQVRPLALSPDGSRLFAVNTPDDRLDIFAVNGGTLTHSDSVSVGLEPVAVAARTDSEVWVVNHLPHGTVLLGAQATRGGQLVVRQKVHISAGRCDGLEKSDELEPQVANEAITRCDAFVRTPV